MTDEYRFPDRLQEMYDAQRRLQVTVLGISLDDMSTTERVEYIKNMVLALTDELHELLNETGWKPWATSRHINEIAYRGELVDVWHFFMNLMLVVGMTPDELYRGYAEKHERNVRRQVEGYDGAKCDSCGRARDDAGWWHTSGNEFGLCRPITTPSI